MKKPSIDWSWVKREAIRTEKVRGAISETLDICLAKAKSLARPASISAVKKDLPIPDGLLSSYFKGASGFRIFLVTIGSPVEKEASRLMKKGDSLEGYLLDRIGSFAVESLAQSLEEDLRIDHGSKQMSVSMRISPGYCDWPIEGQFTLARILDYSKIGVKLTGSCMMVPKKSISGVIGISQRGIFSKKRSQCGICGKKNCGYRRVS